MNDVECADGVSVHYLNDAFLDEVQEAGYSLNATIYDIENLGGPHGLVRRKGASIRCPMDGQMGAAYVHCLEGAHNVGPATHMLSYTWGYTIGDIVGTLVDFCKKEKLDQEATYFWICFLCVNQHRVVSQASVPTTEFLDTFGRRVARTGEILCMMAPWENPLYLRRIWCIYEISQALASESCKVHVALPPGEKLSLVKDLLIEKNDTANSPVEILYEALNSIKVEAAESSQEADRRLILNLLEAQDGGYEGTNRPVKERLKEHLLGILIELGEQCRLFATMEENLALTRNLHEEEESIADRAVHGLRELVLGHHQLQAILCFLILLPIGLALAWLIHATVS